MISPEQQRLERKALWLMAMVQFINIWDFMIVMPLGPDFARELGVDTAHLGWIVSAYSIAAALVGIASARFLDRFDRRKVLLFNLLGLTLSTLAMVLARNLNDLIAVRMATGVFGGPMVASSLAILSDVFPPQRRGEALGKVFGSFSIASILGVPLALEIATHLGLKAPFIVISAVAGITLLCIFRFLPPMRGHLQRADELKTEFFSSIRRNPASLPALLMTASALFGAFLIIPNISAHVQQNMGYPRSGLGFLYFCGGFAALVTMRFVGGISDRIGYSRTAFIATLLLLATVYVGYYLQTPSVPVVAVFVLFMISMSTRNVTTNALLSRIPQPYERAGFMALVSSMQHLMTGVGALAATMLLTETPDHRLAGMDHVALLSMAAFALSTVIMFRIERTVSQRGMSH